MSTTRTPPQQPRHYQRGLPFHLGAGDRPAATDPGARFVAAVDLLRGEGVPADPERGLELLAAAAAEGHVGATSLLGRIRWNSATCTSDGVRLLQLAAERGDAEALHLLGLAHFRGQGVEKDLAEARRLQREAAKRGVVDAQFELSLLMAQGIGGKRDARGARLWEEKAAEAGHARACLNRASRLASAKKPDFTAAVRWYERAAEGGSAEAAARLCKMHLASQGVARDEAAAKRWYERAAGLGYDWSVDERS